MAASQIKGLLEEVDEKFRKRYYVDERFRFHEFDDWYEYVRPYGRGGHALVFNAFDTRTGDTVAIKETLNLFDHRHYENAVQALREIRYLRCLDHPNIIKLLDVPEPLPSVYDTFNECYIVVEYVYTSLFCMLRSRKPLTEFQRKTILFQVLRALEYLHSVDVVHRDVQPCNILVDLQNFHVKLCDFGSVRPKPIINSRRLSTSVTTRPFKAPEMILANIASQTPFSKRQKTPTGLSPSPLPGSEPETSEKSVSFDPSCCPVTPAKEPPLQSIGECSGARPEFESPPSSQKPYSAAKLKSQFSLYGEGVDIWAAGCVFIQLLLNSPEPFFTASDFKDPADVRTLTTKEKDWRQFEAMTRKIYSGREDKLEEYADSLRKKSNTQYQALRKSIEENKRRLELQREQSDGIVGLTSLIDTVEEQDPDAVDLIVKMLDLNEKTRITASQALQHPYLESERKRVAEIEGAAMKEVDHVALAETRSIIRSLAADEPESEEEVKEALWFEMRRRMDLS